jgi:hypothetical protein
MSRVSSSSDGGHGWTKYSLVLLTRCPNCPQLESLVRLSCKKTENNNYGREFVKCESRPQSENVRIATFFINFMFDLYESGLFWWFRFLKYTIFMWIENYIEKLQLDGMIKGARMMGASEEMVMSN